MPSLIHNTVKTDRGDYSFNTREEAEAFFIAVSLRARQRSTVAAPATPDSGKRGKGRSGLGRAPA